MHVILHCDFCFWMKITLCRMKNKTKCPKVCCLDFDFSFRLSKCRVSRLIFTENVCWVQ